MNGHHLLSKLRAKFGQLRTSASTRTITLLLHAAVLFSGAVLGLHLVLFLLLAQAKAGSHGALVVADFFLFFNFPLVLVGWPVLQIFLGYWNVKFLSWGFQRGTAVLLLANAGLFCAALPTLHLLLGYWPGVMAETAARLQDNQVVEKWARESGTVAAATYPMGEPGAGVGLALPEGLLKITVSGYRPGAVRYGVRSVPASSSPMATHTVWLSPEEQAQLQEGTGFSSFSSALSTVALGTGSVTFIQAAAPFPRELVIARERGAPPAPLKILAPTIVARDVLLYGEESLRGRPLTVTVTIAALTPSIRNALFIWLLGAGAILAGCVYLHQHKQGKSGGGPAPAPEHQSHGHVQPAQ